MIFKLNSEIADSTNDEIETAYQTPSTDLPDIEAFNTNLDNAIRIGDIPSGLDRAIGESDIDFVNPVYETVEADDSDLSNVPSGLKIQASDMNLGLSSDNYYVNGLYLIQVYSANKIQFFPNDNSSNTLKLSYTDSSNGLQYTDNDPFNGRKMFGLENKFVYVPKHPDSFIPGGVTGLTVSIVQN